MSNEIGRETYELAARNFVKRYEVEVSEHIIDVIVSVMMTRDKVWTGGSFVEAIVANNLRDAISRADSDCQNNLRIIVLACHNCSPREELLLWKVDEPTTV
jgi:hypothetical protein